MNAVRMRTILANLLLECVEGGILKSKDERNLSYDITRKLQQYNEG